MDALHPGTKWLFRVRSYWGIILFVILFIPMIIVPFFADSIYEGKASAILNSITIYFLLAIIVLILLIEIFIQLAYKNWGYKFTQRELKIEKGVIFKTYKSIPYERIQNVDINRGIIARMAGFSTLNIQTAGYSGGYHGKYGAGTGKSEGYIPGVDVDHAEEIRDWIIKKISHKNSGL